EGAFSGRDPRLRNSHDPTKLTIHALVNITRERESEGRCHSVEALSNVAVIPEVERTVRVCQIAESGDGARLQQKQLVALTCPFDILRLAESVSSTTREGGNSNN